MSRIIGQIVAYGLFIALVGALSVWPEYRLLDQQEAIISLTFSHAAPRVEECRRLTQEEMNALPPNMRKPDECPRERHAIQVEMHLDDRLLYSGTALPSGLWRDGKANVYHRATVDAGNYTLVVGMNESGSGAEFDYVERQEITLAAGQNLVVTFDDLQKTFVIE